jgi:hypothetical protein
MSAHDELLKIHRILLAPGECPALADDDTLTIRLLKDLIIWHRHQRQMAFGPVARPQIAAMQQSQSDNIVAGVPTYGPSHPPRLRKPGESLEEYRAAMGWMSETPPNIDSRELYDLKTPNVEVTGASGAFAAKRPRGPQG